ncbi:MAG: hypothetical protein RSD40_03945, partial [Bacilli bacterium]
YEEIKAFASRASEISRRVATNLAFFSMEEEITENTMKAACEIVRYSLNEWMRYPSINDHTLSDSEKLLNSFKRLFLKSQNEDATIDKFVVEKSIAQKNAPAHLRKVAKFKPVLDVLIEHKYVKIIELNNRTYLEGNPHFFKKE